MTESLHLQAIYLARHPQLPFAVPAGVVRAVRAVGGV